MIIVTPRVSEKAYLLSTTKNTYVFNVPLTANKQQIADAVEAQYEVTVAGVTTAVQKGKAVRFSRGKHRYPGTTNRKDTKRAYVKLAEGDSIRVFDEVEQKEEK